MTIFHSRKTERRLIPVRGRAHDAATAAAGITMGSWAALIDIGIRYVGIHSLRHMAAQHGSAAFYVPGSTAVSSADGYVAFQKGEQRYLVGSGAVYALCDGERHRLSTHRKAHVACVLCQCNAKCNATCVNANATPEILHKTHGTYYRRSELASTAPPSANAQLGSELCWNF